MMREFNEGQGQEQRRVLRPDIAFQGAIAGAGVDPWIHRSEGMRCRTCIWFVAKLQSVPTKPEAPIVGRCRRHAPTMGGYPVVYQTDWCGDHRLDENKA